MNTREILSNKNQDFRNALVGHGPKSTWNLVYTGVSIFSGWEEFFNTGGNFCCFFSFSMTIQKKTFFIENTEKKVLFKTLKGECGGEFIHASN